ncbi:hypothetical protein [Streptomyces sp. SID8352]|uniref:hypothetical protein n=1 Tax=Streptomyces sp. SID8352 TaxID=2690338 RepID=UPI00139B0256|nr:hypothetical protein [Streptomyces sp. SID8352]MYU22938.1 hypothetical protein [Streptomyces sp. SID8352]
MTDPTTPADPAPSVDRAALRDRLRRAICEASGFTWLPDELMEPDEYGEHADAVLAVLPAVDQAAEEAARCRMAWHSARRRAAVLSAEITRRAPLLGEYAKAAAEARQRADRAAVLREAADFAGNDDTCGCGGCGSCVSNAIASGLRRVADETQPEADEGLSGPCDCGEGAVHYMATSCPAERRRRADETATVSAGETVATAPPAAVADALADDLRYVLDYRGPEHAHERPGFWDTSGRPCMHCARLAIARMNLADHDAELRSLADETAATETAALSPAECTMLTYALDQAQERIWSEDGFTDEDQAAVDSLRRLTVEQPAAGAQQDGAQHPGGPRPHTERRDAFARMIYERWNPGLSWDDAHPDDLICYGADADVAMAAADAVSAGRSFAAPTDADIYREVANRLDELGTIPSKTWAPPAADQVREWAERPDGPAAGPGGAGA